MKKIFLLFSITTFLSMLAFANDTAGQLLPTGEIKFERQPDILLRQEALVLSDKIAVDYLFENTSSHAITTEVFFPLPTTSPLVPYFRNGHNFDFKLFVNGKETPYQTHRRVTANGKDVTRYFDLMGLDSYDKTIEIDDSDVDGTNEKLRHIVKQLPVDVKKEMRQLGILKKSCLEVDPITSNCIRPSQEEQLVSMDYRQEVSFYWSQTFPANSTLHIYHEYVPSFLENSVGFPYAKDIPFTYQEGSNDTAWKAASYIVTTANNWQQPIEKFHLLVMGEKGAAVSAYQEGDVSQTRVSDDKYILVEKRDFVPTSEILFEIASDPSHSHTDMILPRLYKTRKIVEKGSDHVKKLQSVLPLKEYVWAFPSQKGDWFVVINEGGEQYYTHKSNLIDFWN